jgi:hypothetical protein
MAKPRPIELLYLGIDHGNGPEPDNRARGEVWELFRDGDDWVLVDGRDREAGTVAEEDLCEAVSFPSFWLSTKHIGIRAGGTIYCFTPERASLVDLRRAVSTSEQRNPERAAAHYRSSGLTGVAVGGALVAAGAVVIVVVAAGGHFGEFFESLGLPGLFIVGTLYGLYSLISGTRKLIKARRYASIAESEPARKRARRDRER